MMSTMGHELHKVVVAGDPLHPGDPRKVGPAQVAELEQFLTGMGLPVGLTTREHTPQERARTTTSPREADACMSMGPPDQLLVLQWIGGPLLGAVAEVACRYIVKAWVAKKRGRKQATAATRQYAIAVARWKLGMEFDVELKGAAPVEETRDTDGAWTIVFEDPAHDRLAATIPADVTDLARRRAVAMTRRKRTIAPA